MCDDMNGLEFSGWCYGHDECFLGEDGLTRAQAVEMAVEGEFPCIGMAYKPCASRYVHMDADRVIEHVAEAAEEEVGEWAESWLRDVTPEQAAILEERLNAVVVAWVKEFGLDPDFFVVRGVEKLPEVV